jgi:hypothetical protein
LKVRGDDVFSKTDELGDGGLASRMPDARLEDRGPESKPPVEIHLAPPSSPAKTPGVGTWVAAGVGVVALSSFAYFGLSARSDVADMQNTCKPNCPADRVDAARSKFVAADISLGIGALALGVAGALWVIQGSPPPQPASSLRLDVVPAAHAKGATVMATINAP